MQQCPINIIGNCDMANNLYSYNDFFPTPKKSLPHWVIKSFNEFNENINKKDFPCLLGIIAHRKQLTKVGFIENNEPNIGLKMSKIVREYLDILRSLENKEQKGLLPLIIFLELSDEKSLEDTHYSAWNALTKAHEYDPSEWIKDIPKDSSSPNFAYCFDNEIWFVNVSSPFHDKRKSRNLGSSIVLAMQTLSGSNCFYKDFDDKLTWQKKIRERTKKYDDGMEVYEGLGSLFNHGKPRPLPESYFLPDNNDVFFDKFWEKDIYKHTHILFDFDGTIADSSECAIISTQRAFSEMKLPVPTAEQIVHLMGIPIEQSFKEMGASQLILSDFEKLLSIFRNIYRVESENHIKGFPNMTESLIELKNQGKKIAIVTSKKTDVAIRNINQLGIEKYIDFVVGADQVTKPKPNPECILVALDFFGISKHSLQKVIMIGDTTFDIIAGKSANVDTCAVTWGSHNQKTLKECNPNYITEDFHSLLTILSKKLIECPFKELGK